jgi:serine protease
MKRISTLILAFAFVAPAFARNPNAPATPVRKQNFTPLSQLKPDEYMANTMIFKMVPQYRSACSNNFISINAINDFFAMIGAVDMQKKFPNHEAPAKKINQWGAPMIDLSLIYEVHYTGAMPLEKAIDKMFALGFFEYVEPHFIQKAEFIPNDPSATQASSYYLYITKCAGSGTTGWDISTGSASTVIGIVDTGTRLTQVDLINKIAYNTADPIDGSDNDGDGYTDNYQGWDVAMNDNDPTYQGTAHGVHVSGCAAAELNNSTLVAGSGGLSKFLPVKIADAAGTLTASYDGIVYAADHGCSVINCSWGGAGGGSFGQGIIDYATNNMDALVIAASGNNGMDEEFFPAAYNKVLSVASTGSADVHSGFTNYNYTVDISSPGESILSTWGNTTAIQQSGTSMASPVCAGIAAIVRNYFPTYNALQVGERLKRTADNIYSVSGNTSSIYADRLGTGRVNLYRALTDADSPSVVYSNETFSDNNDMTFVANDTVRITGDFTDFLGATTNLTATLSVVSGGSYVSLLDASTNPGALTTMQTVNHNADPFTVKILPSAPVNQLIVFKLTMTDGSYTANQYFSLVVNVDYINIAINDVATTITSKGLIGYNADQQQQGLGFNYMGNGSLLYEASFMVGNSSTRVNDMARGTTTPDVDFQSLYAVREVSPAVFSEFDVDGSFRDNISATPLPVTVHHQAFAWSTAPHRKYVIVRYTIKNTGSASLSSVYGGIFADWDIDATTYGLNKADYDATNRMGYVYCTNAAGKYCGIKLLTQGAVNHYAIDNTNGGGGGINIYDGFDTSEKYTALSTNRAQAGGAGTGNDVCDVVSSGPFTIPAGDSVTVAFALIAGDDLSDLQNSAADAQIMYDGMPLSGSADVMISPLNLDVTPNPASGTTAISYNIAEAGNTEIRIVDASGRLVRVVGAGEKQPGNYVEYIDASTLGEGMYFIQLVTETGVFTRRIVITR